MLAGLAKNDKLVGIGQLLPGHRLGQNGTCFTSSFTSIIPMRRFAL